jgi:hypothetical protein
LKLQLLIFLGILSLSCKDNTFTIRGAWEDSSNKIYIFKSNQEFLKINFEKSLILEKGVWKRLKNEEQNDEIEVLIKINETKTMDYNSKKLLGHRKLTFSPISENEIQLKGNNKITLKKVH